MRIGAMKDLKTKAEEFIRLAYTELRHSCCHRTSCETVQNCTKGPWVEKLLYFVSKVALLIF